MNITLTSNSFKLMDAWMALWIIMWSHCKNRIFIPWSWSKLAYLITSTVTDHYYYGYWLKHDFIYYKLPENGKLSCGLTWLLFFFFWTSSLEKNSRNKIIWCNVGFIFMGVVRNIEKKKNESVHTTGFSWVYLPGTVNPELSTCPLMTIW